ncbi:uncharacterized protein LOC100208238 isoform X1 [Hydra vulgaris]|uniref:uncharacterized protein LOC100208238 isoform X1 n=1 Tax=Hydra vulgaris TaxID=6087 RepID=UPI001F5FBAC1|nr:uncharacterized protein LOC100208238 isoform X1 [Hydra vulgaris]
MSNPFFESSVSTVFEKASLQSINKSDTLLSNVDKEENKRFINPFFKEEETSANLENFKKSYDDSTNKQIFNPFLERNNVVNIQSTENSKKQVDFKIQNNPFSGKTLISSQSKKMQKPASIHVPSSFTETTYKADSSKIGPVVFQTNPFIDPLLNDDVSVPIKQSIIKRPAKPAVSTMAVQTSQMNLSLQKLADKLSQTKRITSSEKFEFLDAIDKSIRKGLQDILKRTKSFKGCCQDMCPEKERYLREVRRQGSQFELSESSSNMDVVTIDPFKAVKEYSRSSADQEEPLPHELRPAPVLKFTMDYLICNIMDEKYVTRYDWFDFVWNRLRAIRKDITQQNLKCLTSIDLIEKCARFHIFCSHHLCEEDLQIFDPKINLENLTKCLQTLKHMYEDLWNEKGISSPNEVEFRCYQILLNLNNADTLREAVCFREEVRKSYQVKFALQVLLSVQEKNYVRFFKLLKLSSFLNASLIHSYFNQMRQVALSRMTNAFCLPKMPDTVYSQDRLQNLLCFNDTSELKGFCTHFGLSVDSAYVYLNRTSFTIPDEQFIRRKSRIITEKCITSISEVINGGDLPEEYLYIPTNSFSDDGSYIGSYHILSDPHKNIEKIIIEEDEKEIKDEVVSKEYVRGIKERLSKKVTQDNDSEFIPTKDDYIQVIEDNEGEETNVSHHLMILREDYKKFCDTMIEDFLTNEVFFVASEFLLEIKEYMSQALVATNQMLAFNCIEESRAIAIEVINEEKEKAKRFQIEAYDVLLSTETSKFSDCLVDECIQKILEECCKQILSETTSYEENILKFELCKMHQQCIIDHVVDEEVFKVAQLIVNDMAVERKQLLLSNLNKFQSKKLKNCLTKWISAYTSRVYLKKTLHNFPPAAPLFESAETLMKKLQPSLRDKFLRNSDVASFPNFNKEIENRIGSLHKPIDLHEIVKSKMEQNFCSKNNVWKLGILNLDNQQLQRNVHLISSSMLREKFRNINYSEVAPSILYESCVKHQTHQTLVIVESILESEASDSICDFSGFIYFIEINEKEMQEDLLKAKFLIHDHLQRYKKPSVLAVITSTFTQSFVENELEISSLKQSGYKCWCVLVNDKIKLADKVHSQLKSMVEWLLLNSSWDVVTKSLASYIEDYLLSYFFNMFHEHIFYCQQTHLSYPFPNDVIQFFNDTLESAVKNMCMSSAVNQDELMKRARKLVESIHLPYLSDAESCDWEESYLLLMDYVSKITVNDKTVLVQRLNTLLDNLVIKQKDKDYKESFPWCMVLEECIIHRLSTIYSTNDFLMNGYFYEDMIWNCGKQNALESHKRQNQKIRSIEAEQFKREKSIRNLIKDIESTLKPIQNTLRKRKSMEFISNTMIQPTSLDVLNDSSTLLKDVFDQKNEYTRKRRVLTYYVDEEI